LKKGESAVFETYAGNASRLMQQLGTTARRIPIVVESTALIGVEIRSRKTTDIVRIRRTK
jgi:hypothetical protein